MSPTIAERYFPEISAIVAHDFNNYLNSLVLQAAVLSQNVPESCQKDVDIIRRLGQEAASVVRLLQDYNPQRPSKGELIDINPIALDCLREVKGTIRCPIHSDLDPGCPKVIANEAQLRRLLMFALECSCSQAPAGSGRILLATHAVPDSVQLEIADNGACIEPEQLEIIFDTFQSARPGLDRVSFPVMKLLARRSQAEIRVRNGEKGIVLTLQFQKDQSA